MNGQMGWESCFYLVKERTMEIGETVAIGAFGKYRTEAIRNAKIRVREQFPNLIFPNLGEEF